MLSLFCCNCTYVLHKSSCSVVGENLVSETYKTGIFAIFFSREVYLPTIARKELVSDIQNYLKYSLFLSDIQHIYEIWYFQELPWKKEILHQGCYSVNGKKCYLWVKSSEKSSPALSATHLPSASYLFIAPIYCTNNWMFSFQSWMCTIFYDVMINDIQMYCE